MRLRSFGSCACAVLLLAILPARAGAQEPLHTFDELVASSRITSGSNIQIQDRNGTTLSGRVQSISPDMISLRTDGDLIAVAWSSVLSIRQQRPADPTTNGLLIGLGTGLGIGVLMARGHCSLPDDECLAITTVTFVPTLAAGGALVGWLIDRSVRGYETVYEATILSRPVAFRVSPLIARQGQAIQLSFSF